MAKSKIGGTRALIRGRVGSDVYSIGKNADGEKQQIVRSLAEQVANPQTTSQMRGRMIMSTIMQAVAGMKTIIDHSFDGYAAGQPCLSQFIRENYKLVKADVAAHAAASNVFGLNKYQEKGIKQGAYLISQGSAAGISGIAVDATAKTLTIALSAGATIADLRTALNISAADFFTACAITADSKFVFVRLHVNSDLADATTIASAGSNNIFTNEGNVSVAVSLTGNNIVITLGDFSANYGIIVSRKETNGYKHNSVTLVAPSAPAFTADVALPTYPIGQLRFLNGGAENVANVDSNSTSNSTGGNSGNNTGDNTGGNTGGNTDDPNNIPGNED